MHARVCARAKLYRSRTHNTRMNAFAYRAHMRVLCDVPAHLCCAHPHARNARICACIPNVWMRSPVHVAACVCTHARTLLCVSVAPCSRLLSRASMRRRCIRRCVRVTSLLTRAPRTISLLRAPTQRRCADVRACRAARDQLQAGPRCDARMRARVLTASPDHACSLAMPEWGYILQGA